MPRPSPEPLSNGPTSPSGPAAAGPSWPQRRSVHLAAILVAVAALYGPTVRGIWDLDTPNLVLYNPAVHGLSLANLRAVLTALPNGVEYLPVRDLTYMLDFELWGMRPAGYHLTNVLFYAACCAALYLLLARVLAAWSARPRLLAAAATLLFVAHPVHVEAVAGIAARKDVVSGLLGFASLLAFHAWVREGRARAYAFALAAFALAMLAKASAIVVPALAVLLALPRLRGERRVQAGALGFLAAGLALGLASAAQALRTGILESAGAPPGLRVLTYGKAAAWYARMLAIPWPLSTVHELRPAAGPLDPAALAGLAGVAAAAILAVRGARRAPVPALSVAWFLVAIAPVSGLVPAPNLVAERYLFLPSVGFCLAAAWVLVEVVAPRRRTLAVAAGAALLAVHAGLAAVRVREWRANSSLLEADVARSPGSARLAGLLGRFYYVNGRYPEAFALFDRARGLDPANLDGPFHEALYRIENGDPAGALGVLSPIEDEDIVDVQCLLGMALERAGRPEEARARYERALRARRLMGIIFRTEAQAGLARLGAAPPG